MHIFPIILDKKIQRDHLREFLLSRNIETGIHYYPNHQLTFYKNLSINNLNTTERIYPRLLTLPLHPDLNKDDINFIIKNLNEFIFNKN